MSENFIAANRIQELYPKAYEDFLSFYQENRDNSINAEIENLSFRYQVGWILEYFEENSVPVNLIDFTMSNLSEILLECFESMEHILSHYS